MLIYFTQMMFAGHSWKLQYHSAKISFLFKNILRRRVGKDISDIVYKKYINENLKDDWFY